MESQIELFKSAGGQEIQKDQPKDNDTPTVNGVLKYEMIYLPEKAKMQEVTRVAQLEQRLARLENVIGVHDDKLDKFTQVIRAHFFILNIFSNWR